MSFVAVAVFPSTFGSGVITLLTAALVVLGSGGTLGAFDVVPGAGCSVGSAVSTGFVAICVVVAVVVVLMGSFGSVAILG
jgi:hypothetical protein